MQPSSVYSSCQSLFVATFVMKNRVLKRQYIFDALNIMQLFWKYHSSDITTILNITNDKFTISNKKSTSRNVAINTYNKKPYKKACKVIVLNFCVLIQTRYCINSFVNKIGYNFHWKLTTSYWVLSIYRGVIHFGLWLLQFPVTKENLMMTWQWHLNWSLSLQNYSFEPLLSEFKMIKTIAQKSKCINLFWNNVFTF